MVTIGSARLLANLDENTYPESANIYDAIKAAQTGHLYASPFEPPYVLQPFGPLYYAANMVIARASHLDFDLVRARARLLTYCCFLLSAVFIFLICKRLRFPAVYSILAALMFLGQPFFMFWNATVRPDMLFLTVMLASLVGIVGEEASSDAAYAVSGGLAGLAFLVKQPAIAAPLAVLAILLYRRKVRPTAMYALGAALPTMLVFGILLSSSGPFLEQFTSVGKLIWSIHQAAQFAHDRLLDFGVLVPVLIGGIGFAQAIQGSTGAQIIAAFALANWAVGLSGLPQLGSDTNYVLPGLAGCALLLPFAIEVFRRNSRWVGTFVLVIAGLCWVMSQEVDRVAWAMTVPVGRSGRSYTNLTPFKILSDRTLFALHGRDPDLVDPYTAHELELGQHWNSSPIADSVRRGSYDLIILTGSGTWHDISSFRGVAFFSPAVVQAINENYVVLCSTLDYGVLMPRARDVTASPALLAPSLGQTCDTGLRGHRPELEIPPGAH
jgi:hypothetical protein